MKKIAFIIYVGCVLVFSAFARADVMMPFSKQTGYAAPIQIESVVLKDNLDLAVSGFLPNPCTHVPTASMIQDAQNPSVLIVLMTSPQFNDICISKTADFNTVVNLAVIAQNSQVQLNPRTVYLVRTQGNEFAVQISGADLMRVPGFIAN